MTTGTDHSGRVPDRVTSINVILRGQLEVLAQIEAILGEEHNALANRNSDGLLQAADAKAQSLTQLGELEKQRQALSEDLDAAQAKQLREIATRCRSINAQNAALLNTQQQHVNRLLSLLRGDRGDRPAAYDSSGKTTGKASHRLRLTQV